MRQLALLFALVLSPALASAQSAPTRADTLRTEAVRMRAFIRAAETQASKVIALADSLPARRVDTVRVPAPVAAPVDTGAILRGVCMHLPYATRGDLLADTVVIATADTAAAPDWWCAFGEVRDSVSIVPAGSAPAPLSLAGMVGSALVGTLAVAGAVVTRRRG